MNITRTELSLLRLADGIASSADIDRLTKQFDAETIEAWKNLSSQIGTVLKPSELGTNTVDNTVDVAPAVMKELGLLDEDKALDSSIVQQALSENLDESSRSTLEQSIVGSIMDSVLGSTSAGNVVLNEENSEDEFFIELNLEAVSDLDSYPADVQPENFETNEGVGNTTSLSTDEINDPHVLEDWSDDYASILRSALTDDAPNLSKLTDAILNEVLSDDADILRALEDELNLIGDLDDVEAKPSEVIQSSSDDALLADLDRELEQIVGKEDATSALTASNMDFTAEIPNPIIAERTQLAGDNDAENIVEPFELVVEFTEEDEFLNQMVSSNTEMDEEDSDDEVCSVDESFVTEQMLEEQSKDFSVDLMNALLYEGKAPGADQLDVWSAMTTLVGKPRLRILPDTPDITVVNKVPTPVAEAKNAEEKPSNVEFVNSKRIDADSTISKVSIVVLGSFLSVAAAWMVIVLPSLLTQNTSTINTPKRVVTFEVAEVNQLEVEELEVGEDLNVQILQGEGNAPTIIFLDDMEAL